MAEDRIPNPRNADTITRLLRRGLIKRDPYLRLASDSLRSFLVRAEAKPHRDLWQVHAEEGRWTTLRAPLTALLLVSAGFVFFTQREAFQLTTAFLTTSVAAVPAVLQLAGLFRGDSDSAARRIGQVA
jgi:hypothetical protein